MEIDSLLFNLDMDFHSCFLQACILDIWFSEMAVLIWHFHLNLDMTKENRYFVYFCISWELVQ